MPIQGRGSAAPAKLIILLKFIKVDDSDQVSQCHRRESNDMLRRASFLFFFVFILFPAHAAGPSTPEDWQKMYDASLEGTRPVSQKMNLGQAFGPTFCACVR